MTDDAVVVQVKQEQAAVPEIDPSVELGESTHKPYKPLYEYFGYEKAADFANPRMQEAFTQIWDYAKELAGSDNKDAIMLEVIRLKHRLGGANVGEKPYFKMLMYIRHAQAIKQRETAMRALETTD